MSSRRSNSSSGHQAYQQQAGPYQQQYQHQYQHAYPQQQQYPQRPRSLFDSFFGGSPFGSMMGMEDPFDDPFFRDPFGSFMGGSPFGGFGGFGGFGSGMHRMMMNPALESAPQHSRSSARQHSSRSSTSEPYVEHPDEPTETHSSPRTSAPQGSNGGFYYCATFSSTTGPGGVTEVHHTERDSTGREKVRIERRIRDRAQVVEKTRHRDGVEQTRRELENVREEEADRFDDEWQTLADRHLGPHRARGPAISDTLGRSNNRPALTRRSEPVVEEIVDE